MKNKFIPFIPLRRHSIINNISSFYIDDYRKNNNYSIRNSENNFRPYLTKDKNYIDIIPSNIVAYDPMDCYIRHPYSYWREKSSFIYENSNKIPISEYVFGKDDLLVNSRKINKTLKYLSKRIY